MKNKFKLVLITSLTIGLMSSCVKEEFDAPFTTECITPGLVKTKEVADIYSLGINPSGNPANSPTYTDDDTIEGYVISSDEGGNFYQSMYIQPTDGSKGFNLSVTLTNVYNSIEPGRKVFLKLKGLAYANPTSFGIGLIFGAPPTDKFAVDRLQNASKYIIPSCEVIVDSTIAKKNLTIEQLTKSDAYLNTLVIIKNVQFNDKTAGGTYDADRTNGFDDNTTITDGSKELPVRTSRYANFAGFKTPRGSGQITGVLTKYGTGFQLVVRTERDVKMEKPRVLPPVDPALQFTGSVTEPFTSYSVGDKVFPPYVNAQTVGGRLWEVKQFPTGTGNKFIEMSSFNGATKPGVLAKSYFMVPVDFTVANNFTFSKEIRYNKGVALKVYYVQSSNYTPNGEINVNTFVDITSSFNIVYPATSDNSFTSAGIYAIPAGLTGTGFFVFEYSGTTTITTTIQIDDIKIN